MNGWSILRGLLTGADIDEAREKSRYSNVEDADAARPLWQWCRDEGIDLLQLAIQFCLKETRIHGNPIGSLNVDQLETNIRAANSPMDDEVWAKLETEFGIVAPR